MIVLGTLENSESGKSVSAERVVGEHAFNGEFHCKFGVLVHKNSVFDLFQTAYPAGMMSVIFLFGFSTGEDRLRFSAFFA